MIRTLFGSITGKGDKRSTNRAQDTQSTHIKIMLEKIGLPIDKGVQHINNPITLLSGLIEKSRLNIHMYLRSDHMELTSIISTGKDSIIHIDHFHRAGDISFSESIRYDTDTKEIWL